MMEYQYLPDIKRHEYYNRPTYNGILMTQDR